MSFRRKAEAKDMKLATTRGRKVYGAWPKSKKEERNLILSKIDYDKIQKLYKKVLDSQDKLGQFLSDYKNKLKAFGKVLQDTPVTLEPLKPAGD